jgi:predicted Ser/Thr protein kinase
MAKVKIEEVDELLGTVSDDVRRQFRESRRIMSFGDYVELFCEHPERHARSAAQYIRDAFDYFGSDTVQSAVGPLRRFRLFDGLGDNAYLIGHEPAQNALYRALTAFVREGQINRLLVLHGPNGSAKSSLVGCIARALELYSQTEEGALYKFNWIFPTEKISRGAIGFGGERKTSSSSLPTYAYLDDLEINARLIDEMRDPPVFLFPKGERHRFLARFFEVPDEDADQQPLIGADRLEGSSPASDQGFKLSEYVLNGDLSHKNRRVFEALFASYQGDFAELLKHVQVERFFLSRRYRVGLATVGPQLRVDAGIRQITQDKSLAALPASLQSVTLFEPYGDLVDGNRGMVEYNDLLKRPMDLNRYLLATTESGSVPLERSTLYIDSFLVGTVNETYLDALKTQPEWASYKGRLELVRMPYLRDYQTEKKIYQVQLAGIEAGKPRAPHVAELAALWAVLTRLSRPKADRYHELIRAVIDKLTPLQKAQLYAGGRVPEGLTNEQKRELMAAIPDLLTEEASTPEYEGRYGASPRELKAILLHAAHGDEHPCLSPLSVLRELRKLVEDPSLYEFLQLKPDGDYHRSDKLIDVVRDVYLDRLDFEVRSAMGLIEEEQYEQLFARYVNHVNHAIKGEKMLDPVSGRFISPDETFMEDVEEKLGVTGDRDQHRRGIIAAVGVFRIEHPDDPVDFGRIFDDEFDQLMTYFYEERKEAIQRIKMNLLRFFDDDVADLTPVDREQVERTFETLRTRFGYTRETAREAVGFLVRHRYTDD